MTLIQLSEILEIYPELCISSASCLILVFADFCSQSWAPKDGLQHSAVAQMLGKLSWVNLDRDLFTY
jgi:hypothetical protein